jgi:3-deoxy-D-manno-octulosonate 8-phosphate phosphatase (KDO 8-P phosphatase)
MKKSFKQELRHIKCFVFDVDGVMTDGSLYLDTNGELVRKMSVRDGYALKQALKTGYEVCVITGGTNESVRTRLRDLGIHAIYLGVHQKLEVLKEYLETHQIEASSVLYMGDDLPDLEAMLHCHLATCPTDAAAEIRMKADYVSPIKGGEGCVRDVIEQVLKVNGDWNVDQSTTSA